MDSTSAQQSTRRHWKVKNPTTVRCRCPYRCVPLQGAPWRAKQVLASFLPQVEALLNAQVAVMVARELIWSSPCLSAALKESYL